MIIMYNEHPVFKDIRNKAKQVIRATKLGDLKLLKTLLGSNQDLLQIYKKHNSFLKNPKRFGLVDIAAANNQPEVVKYLVAKGAEAIDIPITRTKYSKEVFAELKGVRFRKIGSALSEKKECIGGDIEKGDIKAIKKAINNNPDIIYEIEEKWLYYLPDSYSRVPENYLDVFSVLLDYGFVVFKNPLDLEYLIDVVMFDDEKVVEIINLFVQYGTTPETMADAMNKALHRRRIKTVECLLKLLPEHPIDMSNRHVCLYNDSAENSLIEIACHVHRKAIPLMIQYDFVSPNTLFYGDKKHSFLHRMAVGKKRSYAYDSPLEHEHLLESLIKRGVDPTLRDGEEGLTAYQWAKIKKQVVLAKKLEDYTTSLAEQGNIELRDSIPEQNKELQKYFTKKLCSAIQEDASAYKAERIIVSRRLDVNGIHPFYGVRPIDFAAALGNFGVFKCLLEQGAKLIGEDADSMANILYWIASCEDETTREKMLSYLEAYEGILPYRKAHMDAIRGQQPKTDEEAFTKDSYGLMPIDYAILCGKVTLAWFDSVKYDVLKPISEGIFQGITILWELVAYKWSAEFNVLTDGLSSEQIFTALSTAPQNPEHPDYGCSLARKLITPFPPMPFLPSLVLSLSNVLAPDTYLTWSCIKSLKTLTKGLSSEQCFQILMSAPQNNKNPHYGDTVARQLLRPYPWEAFYDLAHGLSSKKLMLLLQSTHPIRKDEGCLINKVDLKMVNELLDKCDYEDLEKWYNEVDKDAPILACLITACIRNLIREANILIYDSIKKDYKTEHKDEVKRLFVAISQYITVLTVLDVKLYRPFFFKNAYHAFSMLLGDANNSPYKEVLCAKLVEIVGAARVEVANSKKKLIAIENIMPQFLFEKPEYVLDNYSFYLQVLSLNPKMSDEARELAILYANKQPSDKKQTTEQNQDEISMDAAALAKFKGLADEMSMWGNPEDVRDSYDFYSRCLSLNPKKPDEAKALAIRYAQKHLVAKEQEASPDKMLPHGSFFVGKPSPGEMSVSECNPGSKMIRP